MSYATLAQLRAYLDQVPERAVQRVTLTGSPTGGTFTLSYEGTASAAIAYNALASVVKTALNAVATINGQVSTVTGPAGGPWVVTFTGTLGNNASPLSGSAAGLTGGTSPSVSVEPALDDVLQDCLDRATGIVRDAIRAALPDPAFDYAAYGVATTTIVRGYPTLYLPLPPHQAGSVTLVEYQSSSNPAAYTTVADEWLQEDSRLYRAGGWSHERYRITAVWGYGPTVPPAIEELTLELAVNTWRAKDKGGFTEIVGVEGSGGIRHIAGLNRQQQMILANAVSQLWSPSA